VYKKPVKQINSIKTLNSQQAARNSKFEILSKTDNVSSSVRFKCPITIKYPEAITLLLFLLVICF
jgi:hypothetical protein